MSRIMQWGVVATMLAAAAGGSLSGCTSARKSEPFRGPVTLTTESQMRGRLVFDEWCNQCHPHGEAGLGPPLNNVPLPAKVLDMRVRNHLGPTMPIFGSEDIDDAELKDLINYLQALRRQ